MSILMVGFGSIGQRHYKNLRAFGFGNIVVYDPDDAKFRGYKGKRLLTLDSADFKQFDVVFVCNPTNVHAATAFQALKAGCAVFIEKPLSHTSQGLEKLVAIAKKKKLVTFVACNLRFHPAIQKIKHLLEQKFLGSLYMISLEYGRYLPYQRPGVDYKKVYAAHKSMGGGVLLDDIHDFDLLFWLNNFQKVKEASIMCAKVSNLAIDTEDICSASFEFQNNVMGSVRCDYLQQYKHKNIKIIGEKGNLEWSFRENIVWFEYAKEGKEKRKKLFSGSKNDDERMYVQELKYFLSCAQRKEQTFNDIGRAYQTLLSMKK